MKKTFLFALCLCACSLFAQSKNDLNLIPQPASCKALAGEFTITPSTKIVFAKHDESILQAVAVFNELLTSAAGFSLPITTGKGGSQTIFCVINPKLDSDEAYKLSVKKTGIRIEAKTPRGIFYAMQTLRQLLPPQIESKTVVANIQWTVPCVEISDAPRFAYRGLHFDVSRHFFSKEDVMRYIDVLAYHKMNKFHWHLTDDQGWRIEIKQYPRLTSVGAKREREREGYYVNGRRYWNWVKDTANNGYYTQDDVREVLAYAEKRFVTVIPEIEMPGHAVAALAAYPQYSCSGGPFEVEGRWGVLDDIFCPKDTTFVFLENILTEVAELFPSEYIHIGGDEAPKKRWQRCHHCQELIKQLGLKDEHELQSYFITRIEKFLNTKGKQIIGWDEILEGGLAPNATVMSWQGIRGGIAAAKQHHDVIMTPSSHLYLDYFQADPKTQPVAIGGFLPIDTVYNYEPVPSELTPEESKYILGVQANVWTEYIPTLDHAFYMAYPRAAAVAEIGWTSAAQKDFNSFVKRLRGISQHYDAMGVTYCKAVFETTNQ
ncbi:MAG: beta-N-acetylhexosaminidase [Bacteroidales bacterium]|jgi:hexosaminidase|nr:beta-N-acetylhexosaminidase [Bacteroidales bacterium]